jgi:hypothetical protein
VRKQMPGRNPGGGRHHQTDGGKTGRFHDLILPCPARPAQGSAFARRCRERSASRSRH